MNQARQVNSRVGTHAHSRGEAAPWALASLAFATISAALGTSIVNVALPALAERFGASFASVQWVVIAYLLASTAAIVLAGRLGDLLGSRRLLLAGLAAFTLASLAAALAPSLGFLIAARAAQGAAAAMLMALSLALARDTVAKERTGAAMGMLGTMSALGTALGPSLGGALVGSFGWRAVFLANVPLALASFALAARFLGKDRVSEPGSVSKRLDLPGAIVLAATLVAFALSTTFVRSAPGTWAALAAVLAALGAVAFVLIERRSSAPLVSFALLKSGGLGGALVASGAVSAVVMATLVVGPFHLVRALGADATTAGLVMATGPLVSALVGIPAGKWVDSAGSRRVTLVGLCVLLLGAALLSVFATGTSLVAYAAPLAVLTAGYALFQAANNTAVMSEVPSERRGTVSGLLSLSRNLGLMSGATVLGAVFAAASGAGDVAHAERESVAVATRVTFALAAAILAGVLARVQLRRGVRS